MIRIYNPTNPLAIRQARSDFGVCAWKYTPKFEINKNIKHRIANMTMKTNRRIPAPWAVILCFGLAWGARAGDPESDPLPFHDEELCSNTQASEGMPAKCNRASGVVGMRVRNQNGERLGKIKDVVFDLPTERVSYAVISTRPKHYFDSREKLLAVPLSALTASADGKHLVLNAEKSNMKTAMGFDRNHWPAVNSPSWGAEPLRQKETHVSEK